MTACAPVPTPKDPSRDRHAPYPDDPTPIRSTGVAAWRRRMGTDAAKEIYKERAATVECVNTRACNRGLTRFLVRGVEKVLAAALWPAPGG